MQTDKSVNKEELPVEEKVITGAEKRAALLAARKKNLQRQKRGKPVSYTHLTLPTNREV